MLFLRSYAWKQSVLSLSLCPVVVLSGCTPSHSPTASITPSAISRTSAPVVAPPTEQQKAIAHVRTLPLYQQATTACQQKRYRDAADLLARLAKQSDLTPSEITFVEQQQVLCLKDAGLPAPKLIPTAFHPTASRTTTAKADPASVDCGLALVCTKLGVKTDVATLRQKAGTTGQGTSMAGLGNAAKSLGLKTEGVQISREALHDLRLPAIGYVNGTHFIEVIALNGNGSGEDATATIHDPNLSTEQTIPQERLLRLTSGYLLSVWK